MGTHAEPDKGPSASWQVMTGACGGEGSHPSRPPVGSLRRAGAAGGEVEGKWQEQPGEVALGGEGHVAETLPPAVCLCLAFLTVCLLLSQRIRPRIIMSLKLANNLGRPRCRVFQARQSPGGGAGVGGAAAGCQHRSRPCTQACTFGLRRTKSKHRGKTLRSEKPGHAVSAGMDGQCWGRLRENSTL